MTKVYMGKDYHNPTKDEMRQVEEITIQVCQLLHGRHPNVQGGVLMDLLSMWLAGHAPALRGDVLRLHVDGALKLVPINEQVLMDRIKTEGDITSDQVRDWATQPGTGNA